MHRARSFGSSYSEFCPLCLRPITSLRIGGPKGRRMSTPVRCGWRDQSYLLRQSLPAELRVAQWFIFMLCCCVVVLFSPGSNNSKALGIFPGLYQAAAGADSTDSHHAGHLYLRCSMGCARGDKVTRVHETGEDFGLPL